MDKKQARKKKIGKKGEEIFSCLCTNEDLIATPPSDDTNGWDFLVEVDSSVALSKNDNLFLNDYKNYKFFFQIKSTDKEKRVKISLSNCRKMIETANPFFIVIAIFNGADKPNEFYIYHCGKDFIVKSLKSLVDLQKNANGGELHEKYLYINTSEADKIDNFEEKWIVDYLRSTLPVDVVSYAQQKSKWRETAGLSNRRLIFEREMPTGKFSEFDPFTLLKLGVVSELKVKNLKLEEERFGFYFTVHELPSAIIALSHDSKILSKEIEIELSALNRNIKIKSTLYVTKTIDGMLVLKLENIHFVLILSGKENSINTFKVVSFKPLMLDDFKKYSIKYIYDNILTCLIINAKKINLKIGKNLPSILSIDNHILSEFDVKIFEAIEKFYLIINTYNGLILNEDVSISSFNSVKTIKKIEEIFLIHNAKQNPSIWTAMDFYYHNDNEGHMKEIKANHIFLGRHMPYIMVLEETVFIFSVIFYSKTKNLYIAEDNGIRTEDVLIEFNYIRAEKLKNFDQNKKKNYDADIEKDFERKNILMFIIDENNKTILSHE